MSADRTYRGTPETPAVNDVVEHAVLGCLGTVIHVYTLDYSNMTDYDVRVRWDGGVSSCSLEKLRFVRREVR